MPILGLLNCTLFESVLEATAAKSSLFPVMLRNFSIFLAWSIDGKACGFGPPDGYRFIEFRPKNVPFELCRSIMELGPFYLFAPKFVILL